MVVYQAQPSRDPTYLWFGDPDSLIVAHEDGTVSLALTEAMGNRRHTVVLRLRREHWDEIVKELTFA